MLEPLLKDPSRATGVVLDAAAGFGSADPIFAQSQRRDLTRALRETAIRKDAKLWSSQLALALWEAEKSGMTEGVRRVATLGRYVSGRAGHFDRARRYVQRARLDVGELEQRA